MKKILSIDVKCSHGVHEIVLPFNAQVIDVAMIRRGFVTIYFFKSLPSIETNETRKFCFAYSGYLLPNGITRTKFIGTVHDIGMCVAPQIPIIVHVFEGELIP